MAKPNVAFRSVEGRPGVLELSIDGAPRGLVDQVTGVEIRESSSASLDPFSINRTLPALVEARDWAVFHITDVLKLRTAELARLQMRYGFASDALSETWVKTVTAAHVKANTQTGLLHALESGITPRDKTALDGRNFRYTLKGVGQPLAISYDRGSIQIADMDGNSINYSADEMGGMTLNNAVRVDLNVIAPAISNIALVDGEIEVTIDAAKAQASGILLDSYGLPKGFADPKTMAAQPEDAKSVYSMAVAYASLQAGVNAEWMVDHFAEALALGTGQPTNEDELFKATQIGLIQGSRPLLNVNPFLFDPTALALWATPELREGFLSTYAQAADKYGPHILVQEAGKAAARIKHHVDGVLKDLYVLKLPVYEGTPADIERQARLEKAYGVYAHMQALSVETARALGSLGNNVHRSGLGDVAGQLRALVDDVKEQSFPGVPGSGLSRLRGSLADLSGSLSAESSQTQGRAIRADVDKLTDLRRQLKGLQPDFEDAIKIIEAESAEDGIKPQQLVAAMASQKRLVEALHNLTRPQAAPNRLAQGDVTLKDRGVTAELVGQIDGIIANAQDAIGGLAAQKALALQIVTGATRGVDSAHARLETIRIEHRSLTQEMEQMAAARLEQETVMRDRIERLGKVEKLRGIIDALAKQNGGTIGNMPLSKLHELLSDTAVTIEQNLLRDMDATAAMISEEQGRLTSLKDQVASLDEVLITRNAGIADADRRERISLAAASDARRQMELAEAQLAALTRSVDQITAAHGSAQAMERTIVHLTGQVESLTESKTGLEEQLEKLVAAHEARIAELEKTAEGRVKVEQIKALEAGQAFTALQQKLTSGRTQIADILQRSDGSRAKLITQTLVFATGGLLLAGAVDVFKSDQPPLQAIASFTGRVFDAKHIGLIPKLADYKEVLGALRELTGGGKESPIIALVGGALSVLSYRHYVMGRASVGVQDILETLELYDPKKKLGEPANDDKSPKPHEASGTPVRHTFFALGGQAVSTVQAGVARVRKNLQV